MKLRPRLVVTALALTVPLLAAIAWGHWLTAEYARAQTLSDSVLARMQEGGRASCEERPTTWTLGRMAPPLRFPPHRESGAPPSERLGPPPHGMPWESRSDTSAPPGPRGDASDPGAPPSEHGPSARQGPSPFAPGVFVEGLPPGTQLYAYDASLHSRNPDAPELTGAELSATGSTATRPVSWGTDTVQRVAVRMPWSTGPCAVVLAQRVPPPPGRDVLPPAGPTLLTVLVTMLALLLSLGPVVRRLRRLTASARALSSSGYEGEVDVRGGDEVSELARAFDEAAREIRSHLAQRDRRERALRGFLENTTHDVNIPLTVLQGHLAALREDAARGAPVDRERVASAVDEVHYLGSLVQNLATAARLEAGEPSLHRAPVDLNEVVRRCVARHRPVAAQGGLSLEGATPEVATWVDADVTLVEQAVGNLVSNALRHNRPGGHAAVVLDTTDGGFLLRVLDDGPGIPDEELPRLSERYFRGNEARTRAPGGRGIGLHIASEVARAHGWHMEMARAGPGGLQVELAGPTVAGR
ncbi:HAMP domain-containing protein [Corallococcus sp. M34]|uniref:sensor histidine kinase n=1 Tax=Citreicoccus inhibens TaxID=2849499 RepID=UPI001C24F180|nr:HAMP domain-containing sensor histidine kinase [Citreicoccus inhibens]MBU8896808.1 HAMP domain-containing protein [Citreicoccus inhibens]